MMEELSSIGMIVVLRPSQMEEFPRIAATAPAEGHLQCSRNFAASTSNLAAATFVHSSYQGGVGRDPRVGSLLCRRTAFLMPQQPPASNFRDSGSFRLWSSASHHFRLYPRPRIPRCLHTRSYPQHPNSGEPGWMTAPYSSQRASYTLRPEERGDGFWKLVKYE